MGDSPHSSVVVIPLRGEKLERVQSLLKSLSLAAESKSRPVLVILVLNSTEEFLERDRPRNQALREFLSQASFKNLQIEVLDHAQDTQCFGNKGGVGLARKIGCDFASELISQGKIEDPWIRCTDADAQVPRDYFAPIEAKSGAQIYKFRHRFSESDPALERAAMIYDCYLRYLRLGMRAADSTFAYHSIGSLIAVHADSYRVARGFPDCQAGEDFYFLNKIRKQAPVTWTQTQGSVALEGRLSARVPFGTGRSLIKIIESGEGAWDFYHPRSFETLGRALSALKGAPQGLLERGKSPELYDFAESRRMIPKFQNIGKQCKTEKQWEQRSLELFDAFEQMKFLHFLRDRGDSPMNFSEALAAATFLPGEIRQNSGELSRAQTILVDLDESTPFV